MNEIVRVRNSSYARYEECLVQRDNLQKEAFILQRNYVAQFGDRILRVFEKKLDCIRKKKMIQYVQAAVNHGKAVNQEELQAYLQKEMAEFQKQLDEMIQDTQHAKNRKQITEYDLLIIKRIYYKLVKKIHPDINSQVKEDDKLMALWQRVQVAYRCNQRKDMEELEVLVMKALEGIGDITTERDIPDLEEKIAQIEAEIKEIRETDPYMYKYLLADAQAVAQKKEDLQEELASYEAYSAQLDEVIEGFLAKGVSFTWRMN